MTVELHRVQQLRGVRTALSEVFSEPLGYSDLPRENPLCLFKNLYWHFSAFHCLIKNRMFDNHRITVSHLDQAERARFVKSGSYTCAGYLRHPFAKKDGAAHNFFMFLGV
jgi:hypothetical protein